VSAPFVVAFVPGVTPGKWERIWRERMPRSPLEVRPLPQADALAALETGEVHMALVRDVVADDTRHVIPLYRERTVVVAEKEHAVAAFDELTLAELAGETLLEGEGADTIELVAANVGLALMPMSVARAHSRRDLVARVVTDAPETGIGLAWPREAEDARIESFIGIVRGRTVNSSR